MITHCYVCRTSGLNPYENLAREACLLCCAPKNGLILYLWQNRRTVVIGRNQNAAAEVDLTALHADGGRLARRLSGGGAVYHDLGNLNFTFIAALENYDIPRQSEIILRAVRSFGLDCQATGRNDLTVTGRKFSGSAYYKSGGAAYHHGTLLVNADGGAMSRYLTPSPLKLAAKGVASVRARVTNLADENPTVTIDSLSAALVRAMGEICGPMPESWPESELDRAKMNREQSRFSSEEWLYRREKNGAEQTGEAFSLAKRFDFGEFTMEGIVADGHITSCRVWSDALDEALPPRLAASLIGAATDGKSLARAVRTLDTPEAITIADYLERQEDDHGL